MIENKNQRNDHLTVVALFSIEGNPAAVEPFGSGHIHDTFRVRNGQAGFPDYLLQRINHQVFQNIPALTDNIQKVTAHLRQKLMEVPDANPEEEVLTVIPTKDGRGYCKDSEGNYWRLFYFLKDTRSYDIVKDPKQAYEGGKAYGRFQYLLSDLEAGALHETITNFHNMESRFHLFRDALKRDSKGRVKEVSAEIRFAEAHKEVMCRVGKLGKEGGIPLRITHNDTKFNNVLLNAEDKAQCVIDLDTVMPGYMAYDYGDAIRTSVNKAAEDEKDLHKIDIDLQLFEAFTRGFLEETRSFISDAEKESLALGALMMPFIMGLRFLTDYINGDTYYKINFPEHNLQRCRAQFRLVEKLEEQYDLLKEIILKTAN